MNLGLKELCFLFLLSKSQREKVDLSFSFPFSPQIQTVPALDLWFESWGRHPWLGSLSQLLHFEVLCFFPALPWSFPYVDRFFSHSFSSSYSTHFLVFPSVHPTTILKPTLLFWFLTFSSKPPSILLALYPGIRIFGCQNDPVLSRDKAVGRSVEIPPWVPG